MVGAIPSLSNMEYALYGNRVGFYGSAPSVLNNYQMPIDNSYYQQYMSSPTSFQQNYSPQYVPQNNSSNNTSQNFQALTANDWNALKNYYSEGLSPSETIGNSAISGVFMGVMNNPRIIAHPLNTFSATRITNKLFKDCKKEGTLLYNLWKGKETNGLMQDAYAALNKLEARNQWKIGAFRKRYTSTEYNQLKDIMTKALQSGNKDEIAKATATLKNAYITDGWLAKPFNKLKGLISGSSATDTVASKIADTGTINKMASELLESSKGLSFKKAFAKSGGLRGGILMMGLELLGGIGKIKTAFSQDTSTGMKQIGQTTVKAVGNAAGWALGEAAAIWAMGKAGAAIGTMFGPGIGTLIGGIVGVIGGSIGMCITGKLTRALVGKDVADTVETEQLASTTEGQQQLIQYALEKSQKGEKMDAETQQVVNKIINLYA